ncbi:MAG TPA: SapC family protein [Caldimonas sp.]
MSDSVLYVAPVLLDPAQHRSRKVVELTDFSVARKMHAAFLTATEFPQAALDFAILFIPTGEHDAMGRGVMSPIVLLGLTPGENLHVEGERWDARYIPAFVRRYPFLSADVKNLAAPGVFVDAAWSGFSESAGEPLFDADDKPAPALVRVMDFLERFDLEAQRTRAFCERVVELGILKEMKADVTLPGDKSLVVEGFFAVDEEKLQALPDATVLELHRNGLLMLLQVHLLSMANVRHLVMRKTRRLQLEGATPAA